MEKNIDKEERLSVALELLEKADKFSGESCTLLECAGMEKEMKGDFVRTFLPLRNLLAEYVFQEYQALNKPSEAIMRQFRLLVDRGTDFGNRILASGESVPLEYNK